MQVFSKKKKFILMKEEYACGQTNRWIYDAATRDVTASARARG